MLLQEGSLRWQGLEPIAFQQWKNIYYMKNKQPLYRSAEKKSFIFNNNRIFDNINMSKAISMKLYPETHIRRCGAILLYNLAEVEWITVDCNEPLGYQGFCVVSHRNITSERSPSIYQLDLKVTNSKCIIRNDTCFLFIWLNTSERMSIKQDSYPTNFQNVQLFQFLFDAIGTKFPPIFIEDAKQIVTYEKFANVYNYKKHIVPDSLLEAFAIYTQKSTKYFIGGNLFKCNNSVHISVFYICDDIIDCPGESRTDEIKCQCNTTQHYSPSCKYILDGKRERTCSDFYLKGRGNTCHMVNIIDSSIDIDHSVLKKQNISEDNYKNEIANLFHLKNHFKPYLKNRSRHKCFIDAYNHFDQSSNLFNCYNGKQISVHLLNDLVPDCGAEAEDEFILKALASNTYFLCSEKGQLPCIEGHSKCYDVSQICTYKLIFDQYLVPCRTGQHLYNCKTFKCNAMFKCPDFYCIQWSYICDGKWDCSYGNDENHSYCNHTNLCHHKFKCRN